MFRNYFKLAFKNLSRHRTVSIINLLGLSIGFAVCALIALFVRYQWSFDRMHTGYDRIARLNTTMKYPGASETTAAYSSFPMGPFLQSAFEKEIETYCRLTFIDRDFILQNGASRVTVGQVFAADSTFFRVFNFKLYQGDPLTALTAPQGIVLTKKVAAQIFGTPDVLGKSLSRTYVSAYTQHDTTEYFTVSGILENLPPSSHLQFDALVSGFQKPYWKLWNPGIDQDWHVIGALTYLLFRSPQTNLADVEKQIPALLKGRMPGSEQVAHQLQPMADIHLGSKGITDDRYSNFQPFDRQYIQIFSVIGLFILLIAGINYSNLSTILAGRRRTEIAVRKAIGANRASIVQQFLSESLLTSALAVLIGLGFLWVARPYLSLLDYPEEAFDALRDGRLLSGGITAVFLFGLTAGVYPAFFIGKTQPAIALRSKATATHRPAGFGLVPVLVTGQFVAAIALMVGTVVCFRQMRFMQEADLGYSTHQILAVNLGLPNLFKSQVLKEKMEAIPGVEAVTLSDQVIGNGFLQQGVRYVLNGKEEHVSVPCIAADEQFVPVYGMQMAAGRSFTRSAAENGTEYLINETFARKIGWNENATGQQMRIAWMPSYGTVVGVVKDFHFNSLHHKIEPLCFRSGNMSSSISLKIAANDLPATMRRVEETWKTVITDRPFDYEWLDGQFAKTYGAETRLSSLIGIGAGLAVFIACLGLFALAMFTAESRTKEIGIRKVLGASVTGITAMLTRDYLRLVAIAIAVAAPLAYYGMQQWLADFAYRIEIRWWMFGLAGALAGAVAVLTVGFQSVKAAIANPVKSLRNE